MAQQSFFSHEDAPRRKVVHPRITPYQHQTLLTYLEQYKAEHNTTSPGMARLTGVSENAIGEIARGVVPTVKIAERLAIGFRITIDELIGPAVPPIRLVPPEPPQSQETTQGQPATSVARDILSELRQIRGILAKILHLHERQYPDGTKDESGPF